MSNIGLSTNIYHSTRHYLELLNNFVIEYNYSKETGEPYSNEEVIDFFKKINEINNTNPEYQFLRSFFNRYYKEHHKNSVSELRKIVERIQSAEIDNNVLQDIKELTEVLRIQCAQAYARMKGQK